MSQQTELTNVQFFRLTMGVGAFLSFASSVLYFSFSQLLGCVQVAAGLLYLGIYAYSLRAPFITMVRLTVVISFCIIAAVNWLLSGINSPAIVWLVLPAIASTFVVGHRDGWFWISAGCVCAAFFLLAGYSYGSPTSEISPEYAEFAAFLYYSTLTIIIGIFFTFWIHRQDLLKTVMTSPKAILSRKQCVATTFSLGGSIGKGSPRQFTRHLGEPRLARTTIRSMNTDLHDLEQMPTIVVVVDDPVARYG